MRIMREIPPEYLVAGTTKIDLRKDVEAELRKSKTKIKEIRFREIGFAKGEIGRDLKLKTTKYKASEGDEYFLEIVNDQDILLSLSNLLYTFHSDLPVYVILSNNSFLISFTKFTGLNVTDPVAFFNDNGNKSPPSISLSIKRFKPSPSIGELTEPFLILPPENP